MNTNILKLCLEKGMLLDKETCNILSEFNEETVKKLIEKISLLQETVITKAFLSKNAEKIFQLVQDEKLVEKIKIDLGLRLEISRESFIKPVKEAEKEKNLGDLKVIYSLANLSKKIEPGDFVKHFRNRYNELKRILLERKEMDNLCSINKIGGERQQIVIIGIVLNKRVSKNKNILLEVEDLTGKASFLVNKNKADIYDRAKDILLDDVIAIKGTGNKEIIYVNDFFYPDAVLSEKNSLERDESAAFISDLHIGSKMFLEKNFSRFIDWINGEIGSGKHREEARKIKYLFIIGDTIDGVGIFPGQEELLEIRDIREQYKKLAEYLSKIRKDVKIILCPGQHDSVRVAEPQPFIGRDYGEALYGLDNLILVSNPAITEISNNGKKGIKILMYHGASMNSFVSEIESLRLSKAHNNPSKVVREILKRRHLAPLHGSVTYIPTEKEDPLVIKEVPDIIVTADFHRTDVDMYNNILIICCSCWQSITPFEEKVGNNPDFCKVPVFNLKTREIKILDFFEPEDNLKEEKCEEKENKIVCEVKKEIPAGISEVAG